MFYSIKDDKLLEEFDDIWNKVSHRIKKTW